MNTPTWTHAWPNPLHSGRQREGTMCVEYQKINFELKCPSDQLAFFCCPEQKLHRAGGDWRYLFAVADHQWSVSHREHSSCRTLVGLHPHQSRLLFPGWGLQPATGDSSEHFFSYILKDREKKKKEGKQDKKVAFRSFWVKFRAFTTAQTHGGMLIMSFALNTFFGLCRDRRYQATQHPRSLRSLSVAWLCSYTHGLWVLLLLWAMEIRHEPLLLHGPVIPSHGKCSLSQKMGVFHPFSSGGKSIHQENCSTAHPLDALCVKILHYCPLCKNLR